MLTVRAPIEIKAKTTYLSAPEMFYRRITGNYSLMETPVDGEDLLHLSTTPPEIYVQEGSAMTSILESNTRNENNIKKVEILNNVLNRIVLSADAHVTYQDRVFITDALYKLGIRDDRRFMKAFYTMAQETKNTNTLINLYLEKGGQLKEMIESLESEIKSEAVSQSSETETNKENYLYERVMDRLKTGAVYQIVSNFNRSVEETGIEKNEYSIAAQSYTAQHILLSMLREKAKVAGANLIYLNTNTYEENLEQTDVAVSQVKNEMNGAVLMDMLQNLYHTAFDRFYLNNRQYYRFEDVFFGASISTLQRLTQYQGDMSLTMHESEQMLTENNYLNESEIELLSGDSDGRISDEELIQITQTVNRMNMMNERRRQEYMRVLERIRSRERLTSSEGGMAKTRKDGQLALLSPNELKEKLEADETVRISREKRILNELAQILPQEAARIFELLDEYQNNPEGLAENGPVRRADIGELIYDIHSVEQEQNIYNETINQIDQTVENAVRKENERSEETIRNLEKITREAQENRLRNEYDTEELTHLVRETLDVSEDTSAQARNMRSEREAVIEAVDKIRPSKPVTQQSTQREFDSVPTIHKRTESLSQEELEEQLNLMHQDLTRQIKNETSHDTVTQTNTTTQHTIVNNEQYIRNIDERQIQQMIDTGVKSQISAISNQVFRKLETQMRNEKIRRGY